EHEVSPAREQLHADGRAGDHAGQRAGDQQGAEGAGESAFAPEAQQASWYRDDVEQQVGGCHRWAGHFQDAQLDGQQQHGARHTGRGGDERDQEAAYGPGGPLPVHATNLAALSSHALFSRTRQPVAPACQPLTRPALWVTFRIDIMRNIPGRPVEMSLRRGPRIELASTVMRMAGAV